MEEKLRAAVRILIITQWFDPEPTFKGLVFARALQAKGHEVEVITGFPNYPGGKIYLGYRIKWRQVEIIDGVRINRVPLYPSHDGSALKRVFNYASFAMSSCLYGIFGVRKPDIVYVYHPPLTVGLSASIVSLFRRVPFIYDIQDLWPDTLAATGMVNNKRALSIVSTLCSFVYKSATKLVVLSPGFKLKLVERGVPAQKIEVIYNWCDEQALQNIVTCDSHELASNGRFNVVFAGNMGKAQGLDTVLDAAKLISSTAPQVLMVMVGGGLEVVRLRKRAEDEKISNILFLPQMPMSQIGRVLSAADVLLVHLKDDPLFSITVPSKTQAYLAVGKPVLMAVRGDAADLVREAQAGICVNSQDVMELAQAILDFANSSKDELSKMGLNGSNFYQKNLSLEVGCNKFIDVFKNVIEKRS
ncbi:glycosyltransferase family 4 protein [Deefgea tanakiae]|uniref:Glycosyltransferase family 4 protein n=1 Tax=Deefgea tanakiae TaxID=2865840 RepID=A0ABX8ZBS8_9NEIS|nr:glycosyltransferase family 4 protein [Deefgea tanakiae]QZA78319.1 glycosyltransferase family 4 protein [Deefgea tanakiae]